jgi:monoamine oxidase
MTHSLLARLRRRFGPAVDQASRREFLRQSLAAGTALLLSGPRVLAEPAKPNGKSVIVVGAGFAGLAAAHELVNVGYGVTVIEARSRIGGRVVTFDDFVPGRFIEGGGELIGRNHPLWIAYAKKFGLELLEIPDDRATPPIVLDGKLLSDHEAAMLWQELDELSRMLDRGAEQVVADRPWQTPRAAILDQRNLAQWLNGVHASRLAKKALAAQFVADNGVALDRQSYLGMLTLVKGGGLAKYWTQTEDFHCQGGNQQLAEKLAQTVGRAHIRLNQPATSIVIGAGKVAVALGSGAKIVADDVILGVPPSVWDRIQFAPPLPPILRPQMGSNVKYLISLKNRFWKGGGSSPDSLSDGLIQETWEGTAGQDGDAPAEIVGFSGGAAAEAMRAVPAARRDAIFRSELALRLPGLDAAFVASRFMDWPAAAWTRASYSFPAPGQVTTIGPLLYEGIAGRLHFAGEHACYKFVGYMEGALQSGVAIARRLARRDGVAD